MTEKENSGECHLMKIYVEIIDMVKQNTQLHIYIYIRTLPGGIQVLYFSPLTCESYKIETSNFYEICFKQSVSQETVPRRPGEESMSRGRRQFTQSPQVPCHVSFPLPMTADIPEHGIVLMV